MFEAMAILTVESVQRIDAFSSLSPSFLSEYQRLHSVKSKPFANGSALKGRCSHPKV